MLPPSKRGLRLRSFGGRNPHIYIGRFAGQSPTDPRLPCAYILKYRRCWDAEQSDSLSPKTGHCDGKLHDLGRRIHFLRRVISIQFGDERAQCLESITHRSKSLLDLSAPDKQERTLVRSTSLSAHLYERVGR